VRWRSQHHDDDRPSVLATPLAVRAVRCALWLLVATGALGGLFAATRPTTTVIQPAVEQGAALPPGVAGTAELAVRDWLNGEGRPARAGAPSAPSVDAVAAVATREIDTDYWAVTVGATIRDASSNPTHWYLEIGVLVTDGGPRPVGAPAFVPPPTTLNALDVATLTLTVPAPDDEAAATAAAFLSALLTGAGDPVRYVAPEATIGELEHPPFAHVVLQRTAVVQDAPNLVVRVAVTGTTPDGLAFDLLYELTLGERDGRWEVLAMTGAPARSSRVRTGPDSTVPRVSSTTSTTAPTPGA
jgi:hypothetical protein